MPYVTKLHKKRDTFEEGSGALGSATPALQQMILLDAQIESSVRSVKDQILEKVVKKMLKLNFNLDPALGYGDFTINPNSDPQTASLKTQNLLYAMTSGVINTNDTGAVNALREMLSLPKQEEKEQLEAILKSAQLQAEQQRIMLEAEASMQQNMQSES